MFALLLAACVSAHTYGLDDGEPLTGDAFVPGGNCSELDQCAGKQFCMNGKCRPCKPGQYRGMYHCLDCSAGNFILPNESSCSMCPAGSWSLQGATACLECPESTYAPNEGTTECLDCPAGTWAPRGSPACTTCPAGTYSQGPFRIDRGMRCEPCLPGTFSEEGASFCDFCPEGKVSAGGQSACIDPVDPVRPLVETHERVLPVDIPMWQVFMFALINVWISLTVLAGVCLHRQLADRLAALMAPDEIGAIGQCPGDGDVRSKV